MCLPRQRQPHRAPKLVCQLSHLRYACFARNPARRESSGCASPPPRARARLARAEARPERKRDACRPAPREEKVKGSPKAISLRVLALSLSLVPVLGTGPAGAQPPPSWLDPVLLPAAKAEGSLIVYSSTNEQEGLPLFKLFTEATGIAVEYVRASESSFVPGSDPTISCRPRPSTRCRRKCWRNTSRPRRPTSLRRREIRANAGGAFTPITIRRLTTPSA